VYRTELVRTKTRQGGAVKIGVVLFPTLPKLFLPAERFNEASVTVSNKRAAEYWPGRRCHQRKRRATASSAPGKLNRITVVSTSDVSFLTHRQRFQDTAPARKRPGSRGQGGPFISFSCELQRLNVPGANAAFCCVTGAGRIFLVRFPCSAAGALAPNDAQRRPPCEHPDRDEGGGEILSCVWKERDRFPEAAEEAVGDGRAPRHRRASACDRTLVTRSGRAAPH
jgi:hypothetical protein